MHLHAWAPNACPAPELYARYTWVKELSIGWDAFGGIDDEEINILAQLVNLKREADDVKSRVSQKAKTR